MNKRTVYTFDQLPVALQQRAVNHFTDKVLEAVAIGAMRFNDELNRDDLQARIDQAFEKADCMQTPWFAHEYIMELAGEELRGMGQCDAEDAKYSLSADGQKLKVIETSYSEVK